MTKKKCSYSRFYAIAKAKGIDLDRYKETLVLQFTDGRTSSLREMMPTEYEDMCECLQSGKMMGESIADHKERLRKARSAVLKRMQRLGIDTTDSSFTPVNEFCMDLRIAGKPFGLLTVEELQSLIPKLEAILRKPKIRNTQCAVSIPLIIRSNQLPSCLLMQFEKDNGVHISDLSIYPREIYNEYGKMIGRQIGTSIVVKL